MPGLSDTLLSHKAINNQLQSTLEPDFWTSLVPFSLNNHDNRPSSKPPAQLLVSS